MPTEKYGEDGVYKYVDKSMATQCKEANKQLSITEWLKPILQNPDKHHMENDTEQEVTLDPDFLKKKCWSKQCT